MGCLPFQCDQLLSLDGWFFGRASPESVIDAAVNTDFMY